MGSLGRTPRFGIITTGCTGISRLRRRVAPASLEMTGERRFIKSHRLSAERVNTVFLLASDRRAVERSMHLFLHWASPKTSHSWDPRVELLIPP
jgi:hypothetical protein